MAAPACKGERCWTDTILDPRCVLLSQGSTLVMKISSGRLFMVATVAETDLCRLSEQHKFFSN